MKLEYQFSSARVNCRECETSLREVEHPVLLQNDETRLDLCYACFSKLQSDLQYLARWKHKGHSPRQAKKDRQRLENIAREMVEYFTSSPSRFSLYYNVNILKVFYLERLKVIREKKRTIKQGKLVLWYQFGGVEFHVVYEPFTEEFLLKAAREFVT